MLRLSVEQLSAHPGLPALKARIAEKSEGMNKSIARAGWMLKRKGKVGISGWKKRFVVVDVDTVTYYKGPGEERLGSWELVLCVARDGGKHVLLETAEGSYQLQPEEGTVAEWLTAMTAARSLLFGVTTDDGRGGRSHTTLGASYLPVAALDADDNAARVAAVNELVATEEVYVHNLGVIVKTWMPPLMEAGGSEAAAVFGNVQLLESVNGQLLARLLKPESKRNVGEAFLQLVPFFKMYKDYCANQDLASGRLEALRKSKAVVSALDKAQQKAGSGMPIESYLIMPMQRICRYPLVLGEIYKSTPDAWPDKARLKSAIEAVSATTKEVNEVKRATESQQRILDIQTELMRFNKDIGGNLLAAGRRLICDDEPVKRASVFGEDLDEDVVLFLLTDVMLVCTRDKKKRLLLLHRVALSADCEVQELPYGLEQPNGFAVKHAVRGRVELTFEPEHPADEWRKALTESLASLRDLHSRQGKSPIPSHAKTPTRRSSANAIPSAKPVTAASPPAPVAIPPTGLARVKTAGLLERKGLSNSGGGWRRGTVGSVNDLQKPAAAAKVVVEAEEDEDEEEDEEDEIIVFSPHKKPLPSPPSKKKEESPPPQQKQHQDDHSDEGEVVHW